MKLPSYPILSYSILSSTWKCLQSMPSHHTLTSLSHKTSKPVKHTCDSQTGTTNTPGLLQFRGLVRFITATLSSVQIRNPGIVNLKMSVLVILEKTLVFLWCVLTWLCGVRRRQVYVVEAHESVGDGVVNMEEPQISVAVQNPSKLRKRNVLMISPDGDGQSDSTSVNLISCSPEWMITPRSGSTTDLFESYTRGPSWEANNACCRRGGKWVVQIHTYTVHLVIYLHRAGHQAWFQLVKLGRKGRE